jgi:hypothetical protein
VCVCASPPFSPVCIGVGLVAAFCFGVGIYLHIMYLNELLVLWSYIVAVVAVVVVVVGVVVVSFRRCPSCHIIHPHCAPCSWLPKTPSRDKQTTLQITANPS